MDTVENNTEENISSAENEINTNADSVESSTDNAASAENAAPVGTQPEEAEKSDVQGAKVLVAYFSATNTTKGVAENLADGLGAELYEIVPETPYTDADLNYNDNNSRTTIEMNDPNARPAILGSVENMEQYEVIFLGYPIWWAQAPKIMCTFMESYDFAGKTIIPLHFRKQWHRLQRNKSGTPYKRCGLASRQKIQRQCLTKYHYATFLQKVWHKPHPA